MIEGKSSDALAGAWLVIEAVPERLDIKRPLFGTLDRLADAVAEEIRAFGLAPYIAAKESTDFIFNRIWAPIKRESLAVVAEGVSTPEDVDGIMRANMGIPAGPFQLMDQVGLDIMLDIENHYIDEFPGIPTASRDLVKKYVDAGKLGRKSGEGFYRYDA